MDRDPPFSPDKLPGLVLSGGGARAAYHIGVLRGVAEAMKGRPLMFPIITGISAGAINGISLAARAGNFRDAVEELWNIWETIEPEKVFRTDVLNLAGIGTRWLLSVGLSGIGKSRKPNFLLDTDPLREFLGKIIDFNGLERNLKSGVLHGVAITATDYHSGMAVAFFDGEGFQNPNRHSLYQTVRTRISLEHVLASGAIPILFPPVKISGSYYGDGGIRFPNPLSPAIHLGASRVLAIGIRQPTYQLISRETPRRHSRAPEIAEIAGVLLNSIFMDSLDMDVVQMHRFNQAITALRQVCRADQLPTGQRYLPVLEISPSYDLGLLAFQVYRKFPVSLRYLLRGIGASRESGWDLLSYLAFDAAYTRRLLRLGFQDAIRRRREIIAFLTEPESGRKSDRAAA